MPATFVVVPQWQGSGSSRAMRLVDGAEAIRGDLPMSSTVVVDVPLEAGDAQGTGVHRLSSIMLVRDRLAKVLRETTGTPITIGGDCGVELAAISHATQSPDVAIVWFDAHPDLNTSASSPSGAFTGMVLRTLLGEGVDQLVPAAAVDPSRVILAGARSFDPAEDSFIAEHNIRCIESDDLDTETLVAAVEATGATSVYLHIDLDVIDSADFTGLGYPEPFGVTAATLVETLKGLLARFPLAGAGVTEFAPASVAAAADDMPTILRIIGALNSATRA
ncbi:arginase [Salinibacterium xinjiangense]|uniref:Arginase n=1 Tax=Salinibacterium xinjiangense TaxID=386302 RepID=A0A2C8ZJM8_9MICO|nr:arginase family protein [Salinibacterium xinjiangense]GGK88492.1 arginase [Salinibacterium xinjiangense]SOE65083.1 arginase [Salinibacterium xinjiangense]